MSLQVTRVGPLETARSFNASIYAEAYERGLTPSQYLEQRDPTSDYGQDDPAGQLDAFERVMHASGLIATGDPRDGLRASTWEEATKTAEKRALMHEFCARIWRQTSHGAPTTPLTRALIEQGRRATGTMFSADYGLNGLLTPYADDDTPRAKRLVPPVPLEALIARTTQIEGDAYRSLYITDDLNTDAYRMKRVSEGADIPATTMITGEHTLRIHKFGRALRATYEQLRRQRLDRIAWIVARMALQAQVDKVAMVIDTVVNGDGNANTAATVLALTALDSAASAGTLTLKGWLAFKNRFTAGYTLDVVLAQEASLMQLLLLPVNTVNGMPMAMLPTGAFGSVTPMQDLLSGGIRYGQTADAPALKLVGIDTAQAVERVTEIGGTISEIESFINNQTRMMTMTETEGYGLIDTFGAARVLNING